MLGWMNAWQIYLFVWKDGTATSTVLEDKRLEHLYERCLLYECRISASPTHSKIDCWDFQRRGFNTVAEICMQYDRMFVAFVSSH
jgi:hypothetical protein